MECPQSPNAARTGNPRSAGLCELITQNTHAISYKDCRGVSPPQPRHGRERMVTETGANTATRALRLPRSTVLLRHSVLRLGQGRRAPTSL
jgi:hypothetical protein